MGELNILDVYNRAFGYVSRTPYVNIPTENKIAEPGGYEALKADLSGQSFALPCSLDDFTFPGEPLIDIAPGKKIIRTPIDGQEGTFKELFCKDDYTVTIRAVVYDGNDDYPFDSMRKLRALYEKDLNAKDGKLAVKITNRIAQLFGITQIVMESMPVMAIEGAQNWQAVVITAYSDFDFDIKKVTV